ncbi:MAG: hypothetical protein QOF25_3531 [Mycobacterium sp.]|nr:hypothetical protein [Mycobacterium sp.]
MSTWPTVSTRQPPGLREDFWRYKVLVFRNQHLSPDAHVDAVRIFDDRVVADAAGVEFGDVAFWLDGVSHYRNADRIVHLYDYLLAGARWARRHAVAPELSAAAASVDGGLVGPLRLHANDIAALLVSGGALVDADGADLLVCEPGGEFYLRPSPGVHSATITATVPARGDGFGGRVITGVARDDVNSRLTPVALAVPAPLVVDFHLEWSPSAERPFADSRLHAVGG